jgi:hypothetical protein
MCTPLRTCGMTPVHVDGCFGVWRQEWWCPRSAVGSGVTCAERVKHDAWSWLSEPWGLSAGCVCPSWVMNGKPCVAACGVWVHHSGDTRMDAGSGGGCAREIPVARAVTYTRSCAVATCHSDSCSACVLVRVWVSRGSAPTGRVMDAEGRPVRTSSASS